jgi:glycosyltransferase involved in cell wall biosynthesis
MPNWLKLMDWRTYKHHRFRRARNSLCPIGLSGLVFPSLAHQNKQNLRAISKGNELLVWQPESTPANPEVVDRMVEELAKKPKQNGFFYAPLGKTWQPGKDPLVVTAGAAWGLGDWPQPSTGKDYSDYWIQASLAFLIKCMGDREIQGIAGDNLFLEIEAGQPETGKTWADFCQDFYQSPWAAYLEYRGQGQAALEVLTLLKERIVSSGNILVDPGNFQAGSDPQLWVPTVYLLVTDRVHNISLPTGLFPESALKVLLFVTDEVLPQDVDPSWDLCLAIGKQGGELPLLQKPWQGWIAGPSVGAVFGLLDIRAHAHHFRKIAAYVSHPDPPSKKISVVISTYRRPAALRQALESVFAQSMPPEDYEVIVVNNDIHDRSIRDTIKHFQNGPYPPLRLLECPIPGLSFARNAAVGAAQGEVICFLDDDAIAQENWLERIWQSFDSHPNAGVVGGHIQLKYPQPRPKILKEGMERFWGHLVTPFDRYMEVQNYHDFPWGGNWNVRRNLMMEIGGFRSQYGRRKRDFSGGEELIAAVMVQKLGCSVGIDPYALVYHQPEPNRYTFTYLVKTIQAQIIINYRMRRDLYLPDAVSASSQAKGVGRFMKRIIKLPSLPKKQREVLALEYFCYVIAWSRLFFERLIDTFARFRKE